MLLNALISQRNHLLGSPSQLLSILLYISAVIFHPRWLCILFPYHIFKQYLLLFHPELSSSEGTPEMSTLYSSFSMAPRQVRVDKHNLWVRSALSPWKKKSRSHTEIVGCCPQNCCQARKRVWQG